MMAVDFASSHEEHDELVQEAYFAREEAVCLAKALIDELAIQVRNAADADGRLRILRQRVGVFPHEPDVRDSLTKYLHMRLNVLRPYIPFETDPDKE